MPTIEQIQGLQLLTNNLYDVRSLVGPRKEAVCDYVLRNEIDWVTFRDCMRKSKFSLRQSETVWSHIKRVKEDGFIKELILDGSISFEVGYQAMLEKLPDRNKRVARKHRSHLINRVVKENMSLFQYIEMCLENQTRIIASIPKEEWDIFWNSLYTKAQEAINK